MIKMIVAVFDSAVKAYLPPWFVPASQAAVRAFTDEVNRAAPDNVMYRHPEDYHLALLGRFDEGTGAFYPMENGIEILVRGKDVKENQ